MYAKTGLWHWQSKVTVETDTATRHFKTQGVDLLFGVGVNVKLNEKLTLGALAQRANLDSNTQEFIGLSFGYQLGE